MKIPLLAIFHQDIYHSLNAEVSADPTVSEIAGADGALLLDDNADLNNSRHARGVATELYDLDLTV